jgi:DNA-binding NarL/FixJ family response regulator
MTRVAIVAESERLRAELGEVLRASGRFEVVAYSGEAVELADVVLVDGRVASPVLAKAMEEGQALVILSDEDEAVTLLRGVRGGVALLSAGATAEQIVAGVEAAAAGLVAVSAEHAAALGQHDALGEQGALGDRGALREPFAGEDPLTAREREVLQMLAAGLGNKEIGARLHISDHTAKFHVSQILGKLGAGSRAEAVSIGMRRGIVPL